MPTARILALLAFVPMVLITAAIAQEQPAAEAVESKRDAAIQAAFEAAGKVAVHGPNEVPLLQQGAMALPDGYIFVPQPEAGRLSYALGNGQSDALVGMVFHNTNQDWIAYLTYLGDGYIKDDDAKAWNADDLLAGLKDGTEAGNEDRAARGFEPIEVAGWVEKPAYDGSAHRLVWSALVRRKGSGADDAGSVNYNTYALGREGHFELDLVTSTAVIEERKADAKALLAALSFKEGRRYEDFDAKTDNVAAYGLAALVGGVAAKKLGLLAAAGVFFAKFAKIIAVAAFAGIAGLKRLFGGKSSGQA